MKIAIDVSQIIYPGGVGVYVRNLVRNLLKIDPENEYIFFGASLRKNKVLEDWFGKLKLKVKEKNKTPHLWGKFYYFPATATEFLFNRLRFPKIEFFTGKIDLFHTSDWTEPKSDCPKITTIHDLAPIVYPQMHDPKIVTVFKRKLDLIKKESKMIIAVSKNTKNDLVKRLGIEENRIKVIYEAVSDEFIEEKADRGLIDKFNLKKFIISDAIKNPRKNLENLIKAFENIKDKDLRLVLVGQPLWGIEKQKELIEKSEKKNKILVLGQISTGQLKVLYQRAQVAVFPSFYEGFGLSLLEAMFCGCPLVVSNTSSLPEVAGKAALLVDPHKASQIANAIAKIVANKKLAENFKKRGLKQAKRFSWLSTARKTLALYKSFFKNS